MGNFIVKSKCWAKFGRIATGAVMLASIAATQAIAAESPKLYGDISTREMAALLGAADLDTTLTSGAQGEPLILVRQGKIRFIARGVECAGKAAPSTDVRCTKMQFRASFDLKAYPSATWMNEFNKSWVFGKAYVTPDGKAHVEYPMNLTDGITEGNLVNNFVMWTTVLETFIDHLAEGETAPLL